MTSQNSVKRYNIPDYWLDGDAETCETMVDVVRATDYERAIKQARADGLREGKDFLFGNDIINRAIYDKMEILATSAQPPSTPSADETILSNANLCLAMESHNFRELLIETSEVMHLWDDGLDSQDGDDYEQAVTRWNDLLIKLDSAIKLPLETHAIAIEKEI